MLGFGRKSVDDVLSVFNTAISDLRTIATEKADEAKEHRERAVLATEQADNAAGEAGRARKVADSISTLIATEKGT